MDKWLNHPTSLKIISLALALLLWAVVHFDPESPNTVTATTDTKIYEAVTIHAEGLDEKDMALRVMEPTVVRMMVEGSRSDLLSASPDAYKVWVDLSGLSEGEHELTLRYELPSRVRLRDISPSRVRVELVSVQTKEFVAEVKTSGQPANGYKVGTPIVKPNSRVFVTLPKDRMDRVAMVGAIVSVDGVGENLVEKKVRLAAYDANGKEISDAVLNPNVVEVEVPITLPFKSLPLQLSYTGKLQNGLSLASIQPSVDTVTVYGPQEVLDQLEFYDGAVINLAAVKESGMIPLELKPTNGLTAVEPKQIEVTVELEPSETVTLPQLEVTIAGLSEGLEADFVEPAEGMIDIQVTGAPSVLAGLTAKDVQIIADLNGLPPGQHDVRVDIHLPSSVTPGFAEPPVVSVNIVDPAKETSAEAESEERAPVRDQAEQPSAEDAEEGSSQAENAGTGNSSGEATDSTGKAPAEPRQNGTNEGQESGDPG
ncbi:CdaR family protein [Paenibacillus tarimensis]|uniref:CdaR family protein n=1 Tax=Paenibacillus tarimensis TaxID=416012 RepID=UPI001F31E236|nr:CdaR family protein [Paenibacillus tarimensis]MCF2946367.1 hypothetical protein [Paenibacillus tarimensis]